MELTKQERALIELVRSLSFDDLLDATAGIRKESDKAAERAIIASHKGEVINSDGFRERTENLSRLADALGEANKDFRYHICPEGEFIDLDINMLQDATSKFDELDTRLRNGWRIDKVVSTVEKDGYCYITLIRSEEE